MVWGPYESAMFIIRCNMIIIIIIIIYFPKLNRIFEGLNMLEKSRNFAHCPRKWRNLQSDMGLKSGCGKWLDQRHLYTFNGVHLELAFHVQCMKSWYTHVTSPIPTKKSPGTNPEPNRKRLF